MFFLATFLKWCLTIFISAILFGCGGSSEPIIPIAIKDTTPPAVETSYPDEDGSINFEVDYQVQIIFSELMNAESLIEEKGITLYSGDASPDRTVELEERESSIILSVVPLEAEDPVSLQTINIPATKASITHSSGRFALNNNYTVKVDLPARDIIEDDPATAEDERNYISATSSLGFTTEKGEWKSSKTVNNVEISNNGTIDIPVSISKSRMSPKLVSNKKGDIYLFWLQEESPGINHLWGSRYNINSASWTMLDASNEVCLDSLCSNSTRINTIHDTSVLEFDVAVNETGQLAIVWSQSELTNSVTSTWSKLFDGITWLNTSDISSTGFSRTGNVTSPLVGLDKNGNVISIWREFETNNLYSRIKTNFFKVETKGDMSTGSWVEAPSYLDSEQAFSHSPSFAMSSSGLAVAVWAQKESGIFKIYSSHLRLDQSDQFDWLVAQRIDINNTTGTGDASLPAIAIDRNNDAMAVWLKHDGQRNNVIYSRFIGSWENPALVERDRLGDADYPTITISDSNRALVTWTQDNQINNSRKLIARMFDINLLNGWAAQEVISTGNSIVKPLSSFDREGNAVLLWLDSPNKGNVNTAYFSKLSSSWGEVETIGSLANAATLAPILEDGRFLSIFEEENTSVYNLKSVLYRD